MEATPQDVGDSRNMLTTIRASAHDAYGGSTNPTQEEHIGTNCLSLEQHISRIPRASRPNAPRLNARMQVAHNLRLGMLRGNLWLTRASA